MLKVAMKVLNQMFFISQNAQSRRGFYLNGIVIGETIRNSR